MAHYRVVLDPGHGGEDAGCAYEGVAEKHVNLQASFALYTALHARREDDTLQVMLTRDSDEFLTLGTRVGLINRHHEQRPIQLTMSVHHNAFSNPSVHGFECYYTEASAKGRAATEAVVSSVREAGFALHGGGSKTIENLGRRLTLILGPAPPSVLIEIGYLSNSEDRLNAINPAWQRRLADHVASGIWTYLREEVTP